MIQQDLAVEQNHATLFTISLTLDGCQFNAEDEDYTPSIVVKDSASASDDDGVTYGVGTGIEWVAANKFTWGVTAADTADAGNSYWRLDLIDSNNNPYVAIAGSFAVQAV